MDEADAERVKQDVMTSCCDNMSSDDISKNPVQHSRTKHIKNSHHFIIELVEEKLISLDHMSTKNKLVDIFTKAQISAQFKIFRSSLSLCIIENL